MTDLVFLTAASFLTATLSGVLGLGGGSILIVLMLTVMSPAEAIPFHGLIQLTATGNRVLLYRRYIQWPLVWRYALLLPPGVALGIVLFQGMPEHIVKIMIGVFVLGALGLKRVRFFRGRETPPSFFIPFGFVVGAISIIVGGVGVLFGPFVIRPGLEKEGVVGTQSTLAAATHLAKVAAFGFIGFRFEAHLVELAFILPAVILGGFAGRALLHRVSERIFRWVYLGTLVTLALKLIVWDGLLNM